LAAHADEREVLEAALLRFLHRQRVRGVRVTRAGGREHLVASRDDARLRVPHTFRRQLRREPTIDLAVLEAPDQQRRYEPTVLAGSEDLLVVRAHEIDIAVDADHFVDGARAPEERFIRLDLPRT